MTKAKNRALWGVQIMLALIFLLAGGMKLVMPIAELTKQTPLPGWFLRFLGTCEVLGAMGLILPGLLRIRKGLTPLAGALLIVIMIGATVLTIFTMGLAPAALPFGTGVLLAAVAVGRYDGARENKSGSCVDLPVVHST